MSNKILTVAGLALLCLVALDWLFPSVHTDLALFTLLVAASPFTILYFGRTLYTAAKLGYVVPNETDGPVYRSDKPIMFWSNVILSAVFIPVMVVGAILIAEEAIKLAGQL